jgi:hypothetical protein
MAGQSRRKKGDGKSPFLLPINPPMDVALLSWKMSSHGDTINTNPATRMNHSSYTAKLAGAALEPPRTARLVTGGMT